MNWSLTRQPAVFGSLLVPSDWLVQLSPGVGVLLFARHPSLDFTLCVLRPVPALGPVPDSLCSAMALWEEAESDHALKAAYRRLTMRYCGREQVRSEWEWPALMLRCVCPSSSYADWAPVFRRIAASLSGPGTALPRSHVG